MRLLNEIAHYIPLVPLLLGSLLWWRMVSVQKNFLIMLAAIVVVAFAADWWVASGNRNNMPFFHVYILVEYLFLVQIFAQFNNRHILKGTWLILALTFLGCWLWSGFWNHGFFRIPDYIHALEGLIVLALVVHWYRTMLREKKISQPAKTFEFWFCNALLIFFSGNFLLFAFSKFIFSLGSTMFKAIMPINSAFIILLYLLYTIALLWIPKTNK